MRGHARPCAAMRNVARDLAQPCAGMRNVERPCAGIRNTWQDSPAQNTPTLPAHCAKSARIEEEQL